MERVCRYHRLAPHRATKFGVADTTTMTPRFIQSIHWYFDQSTVNHFAPALADVQGLGQLAMFQAGQGALALDGSWMIGAVEQRI
jgi:maltose-binding protein MalE